MRNFILKVIVNGIAIAITAYLLPGITISDGVAVVLIVGLVFGIVNALVRPVLMLLSCPAIILTLGLFILVINGLLLQLTAWLVGDVFQIDGILWAILGGVIMALIAMVLESVLGVEERKSPAT